MVSATTPYGVAWSKSTSVITPPVLIVAPLSREVGKGQTFPFTVTATSVAGIEKIVGNFATQSTSVNTWTGSLTFSSPSASGDYTATFTAYDNSADHNQTIVTATVNANTSLPILKFVTIPATVGSGIPFQVSVEATAIGTGNTIKSITIGGTSATFTSPSTNTYVATADIQLIGNILSTTLIATAVDDYGNAGNVSQSIAVDGTPPTISVQIAGGTGQSSPTYTLTKGSTATIYNNSTGVNINLTIKTNFGATITTIGAVNATSLNIAPEKYVAYTYKASSTTYPATFAVSVIATDEFSKLASTYSATCFLIVDTQKPTMVIDAPATVASGKLFNATITAQDVGPSGLATTTFISTYDDLTVSSVFNAGKSVLNLTSPSATGNYTTLSAYIEDKAGNATSLTRQVYVDGTPPTITVKLSGSTIYLVSPSETRTYSSSTTGAATIQLYYGKSTPTIVGTVTDNSGTNINVSIQYGTNLATISTTTPSTTFSISLENASTSLVIKATDIVLNVNDSTITFVATRDITPPTVTIAASADTSTTKLSTTSTLATVVYTAYDDGSGLVDKGATLTITSTYNVSIPSSILVAANASKTINVMNLLLNNGSGGLEDKAGVATATIAATDNVGNSATKSDSIYFDFRFLVAAATRIDSGVPGSPVVITFNTVATTSAFASTDLYLATGATHYYVYNATLPNGTSKLATITVFATESTNLASTTVAASALATGTYYLHILSGIVGATTTTKDATISNSGLAITIP